MTRSESDLLARMDDKQLAVVELCGHSHEVRESARRQRERRFWRVTIDVSSHCPDPLVRIPVSGR